MSRLYFVLCLVCTCSVAGQSVTYGLMGLKVTLKPEVTGTKQPDEILWKHNGNKVVEFDGRKQQEFGLFENRVTLDWISAELSIRDLRFYDSGDYDLEVYADKVLKRQTLKLEVWEKLAKPNIKCERSSNGEEATLTCSVESRQPQYLEYEWISHGRGPRLTVPLSDKNEEYTCVVRNLLSNATAKVTAKACYPDEGVSALIIGLIVAVVLVAVIAVVGIICCKKTNKACFRRDGEKTNDERYGLNNETPPNEEGTSLIHRTPTVPSAQRLGGELLSNINTTSDLERSDTENMKLYKHEIPVKGSVRKQVKEFERNSHIRNLFQDTATAPLRKSSFEGSNSNNKSEADAEQLDPSRSDQETEPGAKQSSCEGPDNVPSNEKSDADAEQLDPSHSDQETEAGGDLAGLNSEAPQDKQSNPPSEPTAPSAQQPVSLPQDDNDMTSTCIDPDINDKNDQTDKEDGESLKPPKGNVQELVSNFENNPDNQTDTKQFSCAETKQLDPLHPEQRTEAGLNSEAPQDKQSNPPSEPTAPSAQQPVSLPQDDNDMTSDPDINNKNDQTDKEDGESQMPQKGFVKGRINNFENNSDKQAEPREQTRKNGPEKPPTAKKAVMPPVPRPHLSQRFPAVGTKDPNEHNEDADSNQVTDKTEEKNVELSESEKNNDPDKNSQMGKSVSDETKSDNNQSQSPPSPEKPDQNNSELQESPDATHSDLDQQNTPECEEQSDNNTTVSTENKGKDGDTDDNEDQCSAKVKQSDEESENKDSQETKESDKESDDEDTEETKLTVR